MTALPQVLRNVRVGDRDPRRRRAGSPPTIAAVEAALGDAGRVLVRPSGTEPLVRVMVEAAGAAAPTRPRRRLAAGRRGRPRVAAARAARPASRPARRVTGPYA